MELIKFAEKAANRWRGTDNYHQAATIIDGLLRELNDQKILFDMYGGIEAIEDAFAAKEELKKIKDNYALQKRGKWLCVDESQDSFDCSECGAMVAKICNFCPRCGAKMNLEEK